ncbi:tyrosine-type recombinase/integrase, partial [Streptomyces rhizosphaericola]|uniref:tyrosine-type recombinase/integrase n=1 Tax=Streptomyces rhizosphaericola TaxID=2564098 RepID=UPI0039F06307
MPPGSAGPTASGAETGAGGGPTRPERARPATAGRLDGGTASIHHSLQRTRTGGLTTLHTKTRASERRIALPTECVHYFKNHWERQQEERRVAGTAWSDSGLVFTTPTGRPLTLPTSPDASADSSTGPGSAVSASTTSHSTATLLMEQGVDLVVIKELLGHAHIGVTAGVYAHVRLRLQRQAMDALGHALGGQADDPDDPPCRSLRPLTLRSSSEKAPP